MTQVLTRLAPVQFLREAHRYRAMIGALAIRDIQARYIGTFGGLLWAFVRPVTLIAIYYFVFVIGFRAQGPEEVSFILWFVAGLVPWFFFNDALVAITNAVTANAHLVKKTVFPTQVLPLVHVGSGLFLHLIFMFILLAMMLSFQVPQSLSRVLALYYLFCAVVLLLGMGWLLAALQVFYRDTAHAVGILLNLWFWATPIVWSSHMIPERFHWVFTYNPMHYIVEGYRGALIFNQVHWPNAGMTLYFWAITLAFLFLGGWIFHRLKPEFADVI